MDPLFQGIADMGAHFDERAKWLLKTYLDIGKRNRYDEEVLLHKLQVTPTGVYYFSVQARDKLMRWHFPIEAARVQLPEVIIDAPQEYLDPAKMYSACLSRNNIFLAGVQEKKASHVKFDVTKDSENDNITVNDRGLIPGLEQIDGHNFEKAAEECIDAVIKWFER